MRAVTTAVAVLLYTVLFALCSAAYCPANGHARAIYVTSNMGDNIWSFDTTGNYVGEVLHKASFPSDVVVDKLRAMRFGPGGHLYVCSAKGAYSRIFAVSGNGLLNHTMRTNCTRDYLFTAVKQDKRNVILDHPYDMVFHPTTHALFVANQNTITISKYVLTTPPEAVQSGDANPRYPAWEPAANVDAALPRTNESNGLDQRVPQPITVPDNAGLFASTWNSEYFMGSVRGLAMSPLLPRSLVEGTAPPGAFSVDNTTMMHYLVVCDLATSTVHAFDPETGERMFGINVPSPVQVSFPARMYNTPTTTTREGVEVRHYGVPYIYVTSKEDGMAYMLRFTSATTSGTEGSPLQAAGATFDGTSLRPGRLYHITRPSPLHATSGIYENPNRDVLLVADRNGRRVSQYASPFVTDFKSSLGPSPFLGYFVKQLPDQPEFILSTLLEHQSNIPFCYELGADGQFRYVALCTAARIWSTVLVAVVIVLVGMLVYRQIQRCSSESPSQHGNNAAPDDSGEVTSLLSGTLRSYGTATSARR